MTFLDVAGPCPAVTAARTRTRAIVGGWVNAGWRAGLCLGAALGAGILLIGGAPSFVYLGAVVGAVVGALAGLAVGSVNGLVLALLATTSFFGSTARDPARRATTVAVLTTAVAGLAVQLALLGRLPGHAARVALVYVPMSMGVLAAAVLSRRLPPGRPWTRVVVPQRLSLSEIELLEQEFRRNRNEP